MVTYLVRVWLPDRPGALGAVASRVGAVGGDVVGIDILERGAGRAIDELMVDLPDEGLVDLLVQEIAQVDGVDIEDVRRAADALRDPRLDALETAAVLVGASTPEEALEELCVHTCRTIGATWGLVIAPDEGTGEVLATCGEGHPALGWVLAFLAGSQTSARQGHEAGGPDDVVWAPLPAAGMVMVAGRDGQSLRARERRQVAALARIVDTRFRELRVARSRSLHPSMRR